MPSFASSAYKPHAGLIMPPTSVLASLGIGQSTHPQGGVAQAPREPAPPQSPTLVVAPGLPALRRGLVEVILAGQYVDLTELPPARGYTKPTSALLEGQLILLQPGETIQAKRLIPDLATWVQCYTIYTAVMLTRFPEKATSLLAYAGLIAKLSRKFRWPSWVIYDTAFRQEVADAGRTDWAKIDASLHAQCFSGMATTSEGWCSLCKSLDHVRASCPLQPQTTPVKRTAQHLSPFQGGAKRFREGAPICLSFNKNEGSCSFPRCGYRHICLKCHGTHPQSRCPGYDQKQRAT